MECSSCHARAAVGACKECRKALCDDCGHTCQRCKRLVCDKHAERTPHGRLLCPECMAARNAAAEKRKREQEAASAGAEEKPKKAAAPVAEEDTSFAALAADEPEWISTAKEEPEPEPPPEKEPAEKPERELDEQDIAKARKAAGMPEGSGKLDLGPIDENRPILTKSAQQSPGYWRYVVALIFFLIAVWIVYTRVPSLRFFVLGGIGLGALAFAVWGIRVWIARSQTYQPKKEP